MTRSGTESSSVHMEDLNCEGEMINLSKFSLFIFFILHSLSTGSLNVFSEAQQFSNLIPFPQSVQVRDNWILLLNSYISPN